METCGRCISILSDQEVELRGVDEVEVDAGDGNDLIDAGDADGDLTTPRRA